MYFHQNEIIGFVALMSIQIIAAISECCQLRNKTATTIKTSSCVHKELSDTVQRDYRYNDLDLFEIVLRACTVHLSYMKTVYPRQNHRCLIGVRYVCIVRIDRRMLFDLFCVKDVIMIVLSFCLTLLEVCFCVLMSNEIVLCLKKSHHRLQQSNGIFLPLQVLMVTQMN